MQGHGARIRYVTAPCTRTLSRRPPSWERYTPPADPNCAICVVAVALQLGATQQLDNICSQRGTSESLRHFASGALLNINTAVEVAESASTPRLWRGRANGRKASASNALDLSEAAHSAIVARQQKEERARQQRWRRANRAPRPTSAQTPRDAGPSGSPAPAPTTAPAAAPPPQGSPQGSPPPRGMPSPRVSPPLRSPQQRRAAGDAPPSSKDEEEALQMRIPFVQLAQVCAASQRSNDNDEEASEAPSSCAAATARAPCPHTPPASLNIPTLCCTGPNRRHRRLRGPRTSPQSRRVPSAQLQVTGHPTCSVARPQTSRCEAGAARARRRARRFVVSLLLTTLCAYMWVHIAKAIKKQECAMFSRRGT